MKRYHFHISGIHCNSCKILIEAVASEQSHIFRPQVNMKNNTLILESDLKEVSAIITKLNDQLGESGYRFSHLDDAKNAIGSGTERTMYFWQALAMGLGVLFLFFMLQKSGLLNFGLGGTVTPVTSFLIGLIASVSSCLAIIGGLVLSLSAKTARESKNTTRPFALFHLGRLLGYGILGGILGLAGKTLGISFVFSAVLGLMASVIMILLGLNLIGVLKKSMFTLPGTLFSFFRSTEQRNIAPFLLGLGTFFLPCGFTQSMQIAALSSGSFFSGASIMLSFSLGTLPMLVLLSFGSASFVRSKYAAVFLQSAGIVVIGLGIFALLSGLSGLGIIPHLFTI